MPIPTHLRHQQPSPIAVSTPMTTTNSSTTSAQVLSLETLPAARPICSTYFTQSFANYSIITPHSAPIPINPIALLPHLGLPLKSSVLSLPAAVWNAPTSHHTIFDLKLLRSATNRYHKFIATAKKSYYASLVQSSSSKPRVLWKATITSYTELQIAPYPHHPLWLP